MHIASLEIKNLRAIRGLSLDLETANEEPRRRVVLLGTNGAGKTTIIDAIAHIIQVLGPKVLGATQLVPSDVSATISAASAGNLGRAPRATIGFHAFLAMEEREIIRPLFPSISARGAIAVSVPSAKIIFSQDGGDPPFDQLLQALFRDTREPPGVLIPADRGGLEQHNVLVDDVMRFDPREGCFATGRERFAPLAARLALATAAPRFDPLGAVSRMWKVLSKYFPELPKPETMGTDLGLWFVASNGSVVPLSKLSSGERALLLIFGELALRRPQHGVVLIDEIEQHLHPRWQRTILEALRSLLPSAQFIITTQSPYVAAVAPDDVFKIGDWDAHGE